MFEDDRDDAVDDAAIGNDEPTAGNDAPAAGQSEAADGSEADDSSGGDDRQSADFVEDSFEASPHEPDPPSFDVTSGEDLVDNLPAGSEVSSDVRRSFWEMVVLIKIALLAISLGIMLAYFRGWLDVAAGLGVVAAVAGLRLVWRVRSFDDERDDA